MTPELVATVHIRRIQRGGAEVLQQWHADPWPEVPRGEWRDVVVIPDEPTEATCPAQHATN